MAKLIVAIRNSAKAPKIHYTWDRQRATVWFLCR